MLYLLLVITFKGILIVIFKSHLLEPICSFNSHNNSFSSSWQWCHHSR